MSKKIKIKGKATTKDIIRENKPKSKTISFRFPLELMEMIDSESRKMGIKRNNLVRQILEYFLKNRR